MEKKTKTRKEKKAKYFWGSLRKMMQDYDDNNKKGEYSAQKIRDYFMSDHWKAILLKNTKEGKL